MLKSKLNSKLLNLNYSFEGRVRQLRRLAFLNALIMTNLLKAKLEEPEILMVTQWSPCDIMHVCVLCIIGTCSIGGFSFEDYK